MPERKENIFKNYVSPMRDHDDKQQTIVQGEISQEALDRIKKAEKGELRAKLADILSRGIVQDRLTVDLPDDLHGEWVRNDPLEIRRLESLGFKVDDTYATSRAIHSDGTNSAIVGDVIHMICPKQVKEIIDEINHEAIINQHSKKKVKNKSLNTEDVEFLSNVAREKSDNVIAYSHSDESAVTHQDLPEILKSINNQ